LHQLDLEKAEENVAYKICQREQLVGSLTHHSTLHYTFLKHDPPSTYSGGGVVEWLKEEGGRTDKHMHSVREGGRKGRQ